jgi:hypothetical protein
MMSRKMGGGDDNGDKLRRSCEKDEPEGVEGG